MQNRLVISTLLKYINLFPKEEGVVTIKNAIRRKDTLISRKSFYAHVTASALVVDRSFKYALLIKHKTLDKLLQPGGHLDAQDATIVDAAKRELFEETGFKNVQYFPLHEVTPEIPLDIDVHKIPKNAKKNEPAHYHIDCRYIFVSSKDSKLNIDQREVSGAAWFTLEDVVSKDAGFKRLVAKIREYHSSHKDNIFFRFITHDSSFSLEKRHIVAVSHILPDIPNFIHALKQIAKTVVIVVKPNSIHAQTMRLLRREKIVRLSREELSEVSILNTLFKHKGPYYVMDVGGYFANKTVMKWNRKNKKIKGIVEDTENGFRKYIGLKKSISIPVLSVARSNLKNNEDDLVGYNVAYFTEMVLREIRYFPRHLTCGVIGYGKIGRGITTYLFNQNIKPLLYDINPVRMVQGFKDGCVPVSRNEMLANADVLFCATGSKSLSDKDFLRLKVGASIASVTSSDDEFDMRDIKRNFKYSQVSPHIVRLQKGARFFYLINNGNAVNFIGGEQVGNFIRLVQAEIITCFKKISLGTVTPGIHNTHETTEKRIANTFLQVYLQLDI